MTIKVNKATLSIPLATALAGAAYGADYYLSHTYVSMSFYAQEASRTALRDYERQLFELQVAAEKRQLTDLEKQRVRQLESDIEREKQKVGQ
jgi:hypothetical protein